MQGQRRLVFSPHMHKDHHFQSCSLYLSNLIWVDDQDCFAVDLLDLFWSNQVSHAHRPPARLSLPQHSMHGGQQSTDVTLFPLNPVQNLGHKQERERGGTISQ